MKAQELGKKEEQDADELGKEEEYIGGGYREGVVQQQDAEE